MEIRTQDGQFSVDPVSNFGSRLIRDGRYEPALAEQVHKYTAGGVFVDVGANEGYFSIIAGLAGARVLAIEPQARLLPVIRRNLELNNLKNVVVENVAISDHAGKDTFYLAPSTNPGSSGLIRSTKYPLPSQEVRLVTLEHLLSQHNITNIDFLKVDVEGFEHEVVFGSPTIFTNHRVKRFFIELHPHALKSRGKSSEAIIDLLRSAGYTPDDSMIWSLPANETEVKSRTSCQRPN